MPKQWKNGRPPKGVRTTKVLVLGPDEFHESDYPFVKGVMDDATAKFDNVEVVLVGNGNRYFLKGGTKVYFGIDFLVRRWATYFMWTQHLVHSHSGAKARNADLLNTIGDDPFLVIFDDGECEETADLYAAVSPYVRRGRKKVIHI